MAESVLAYYQPYYSVGILRLFTPYGPGQVNRLIPRVISAVQTGQPVALSRGGEPRINPIYISDLLSIIQQALADSRSYTVNVAGPRALSMRQLAVLIGRLAHRKPHFIRHDADVQGNLVADTRLMHELFNLDTLLGPEEGLSRLIAPTRGRRREE
jgi:nucleoside-diphosphate-sugar epimerase